MEKAFTLTKWIKILRQGKSIYNIGELMKISGLSDSSLRRAILRLTEKELLFKLSKGLYANSFSSPSLEEVASVLYPPSYISLESALFIHGIIDQTPQLVTCITLNKTKIFHTDLGEISYSHIKKGLFSGFQVRDRILLALPEKAALDFVYLQRQNGIEPRLDEWNLENLNSDRLFSLLGAYPKIMNTFLLTNIR